MRGCGLLSASVASYVLGAVLIHAKYGLAPAPVLNGDHQRPFSRKGGDVTPLPPVEQRDNDATTANANASPAQSATSCGFDADLVVGVLSAPGQRSAESRQAIRETWMKLPTKGYRTTMKFLLALDKAGNVPAEIAAEANRTRDILILPTLDAYWNLSEKVRLYFKWTVDACPHATFVLKTDDDSFVRLDSLAEELNRLPTKQLLYGRIIKRQPAEKNKKGQHHPDNYQKLRSWPDYASGAGYMVTRDVATLLAYPPVPLAFQKAEDRRLGLVLYGFNVTYEDTMRFRPWGHCVDDVILLHYNRRPDLLHRRYNRILKGESICGEGWAENEACLRSMQSEPVVIECPNKKPITEVLFASYGIPLKDAGGRHPWCDEGLSSLSVEPSCHYERSKEVLAEECVGKDSCNVVAASLFGAAKDPCPRQSKHLQIAVKC